ncbi:MAG TPA: DUF2089 domain-containing protein [Ktedonobacterales bacterium]|jgi:hypothetical protein|nr:DUF2089 domain-containing protein [Ktedonobacterales bacterium]
MAQTHEVDGVCPVCGETMRVTRLGCPQCGSALEGVFHVRGGTPSTAGQRSPSGPLGGRQGGDEARFGRLTRLDATQLDFVETFLRCRGVIKNVEDMLGISYPTVKARLGEVLAAMGFGPEEDLPDGDQRRSRREILADLAAGRISTEAAHRLLARQPEADTGQDQ